MTSPTGHRQPMPDRRHDESAFDRLFEAYFDPLRRYVYRYVRSWDEADDLVHDLFARLWERWAELGAVVELRTYLYTAARNRALTHLKHRGVEDRWRQRHDGPAIIADGPMPSSPPDPEHQLLSEERSAMIQRAVDALPTRQREVLLHRWAGESYDQIGATLGISPNTVSVHMTRALAFLRRHLAHLLS